MRIVVSGTHASGKSTLISDFALRHPGFTVLADPFDLVDEMWDGPSAASFVAQLRVSAARLEADGPGDLIAERGPLDFLAYLTALDAPVSREEWERMAQVTRRALEGVDVLVVLPLNSADAISVGADEDEELREAMNDVLLDLVDDPDLVGDGTRIVEIAGDREQRSARLEEAAFGSPT
ncbi:AAA family ATPase [Microbacterium sp.]|uniref:AAA family ATPase n=1 Tax=Microbacterium sp. TaxID=51671 RepID=UPI003F71748A